ncbi:MAG: hypothetical protein ACTSPB_03550 [Candidatus Thorarchaeota archaeon]
METKWEWIANRLEELGYDQLATDARKIDRILTEMYEERYTKTWIEEYDEINEEYEEYENVTNKLGIIWDVANAVAYCVACEASPTCTSCQFGKKYGECWYHESLFGKFCFKLAKRKKSC